MQFHTEKINLADFHTTAHPQRYRVAGLQKRLVGVEAEGATDVEKHGDFLSIACGNERAMLLTGGCTLYQRRTDRLQAFQFDNGAATRR